MAAPSKERSPDEGGQSSRVSPTRAFASATCTNGHSTRGMLVRLISIIACSSRAVNGIRRGSWGGDFGNSSQNCRGIDFLLAVRRCAGPCPMQRPSVSVAALRFRPIKHRGEPAKAKAGDWAGEGVNCGRFGSFRRAARQALDLLGRTFDRVAGICPSRESAIHADRVLVPHSVQEGHRKA